MNSNNTVNGCLVEEYHKGRAILLKSPSSRSHGEIELLKQWLPERVKLFSSLQLSEGMNESYIRWSSSYIGMIWAIKFDYVIAFVNQLS